MNISSETTFLGPARVLDTDGARVLVAMPDQKAWATPAMPYAYDAAPGDTLLVIGRDELFYVIGVIAGAGATTLRAPGDLHRTLSRGWMMKTCAPPRPKQFQPFRNALRDGQPLVQRDAQ